MSMAHAVEGRFPFLDHRVVELCASLPPRAKLKGLREKHLLREAVRQDLPECITDRPKQPYRAPDAASFLGGDAPDYVEELLSQEAICRAGLFDPRPVAKLAQKCRSGAVMGQRDGMAVTGILSAQLLDSLLIRGEPLRTGTSARKIAAI